MKKLAIILVVISLIFLMPVTACQTDVRETHTPIPVKDMGIPQAEQEAPDDIVIVPGGGPAYRANVHQQDIANPWPSIVVSETYLVNGADEVRIFYRSLIETAAGETRNNIIKAIIPGKEVNSFNLYADDLPQGIKLTDGMQWSGPSARASVLVIEIAPNITPMEYPLKIGLVINGQDYGTITCTIRVIEDIDQPQETRLDHAKPYTIVKETNWTTEEPERNTVSWHITSTDASGFEECAQTAAKAVLDLYNLYKRDFSSVTLIPAAGVHVPYAHASFAADGKGVAGMTGDAPAHDEWYWHIRAADRELNQQELAIAKLWWDKQNDFPQKNPISCVSYDEVALRQYIADALSIPYAEVQMPGLDMLDYQLDQSFIDWTISITAQRSSKPSSDSCIEVKIEPSPGSYLSSGNKLSGVILKDVQVKVDVCDKDYFSPWFPSQKKGEPCLVVSGHIQNLDKDDFEISMSADGYDETGERVSGTLDIAHIAGTIGLHLEYEETGEFILHLYLAENISTIRISAANYPVTPP